MQDIKLSNMFVCNRYTLSPLIGASASYLKAMDEPDIILMSTPKAPKDPDAGTERGVATKTRTQTKKPSMYRVLMLNDDYTPMEFVVSVLVGIFNKSAEDATQIMLNVHQNGVGICGIYTYEIAETKVTQVMDAARRAQHPLQCTMEKAE